MIKRKENSNPYTPETLIFIGVILFYIAICSPYLFDNHFFAPDADRIAMDGAFLKDFILDLPGSLLHPYEYTVNYYAKYPALSIGYRPIFFQSMEAVLYLVLGTSYVTSKITVLCYLFTGMFFWIKLVKKTHNFQFAICSLVLWITNPMVYSYCQQSMLEIPTLSMVIISAYFIYKYYSDISYKNALVMSIIIGLTLWTNQKSAFVLLTIGVYAILSGNWKTLVAKKNFSSYFVLLLFIVPLAMLTLWLGAQNLSQSIGTGAGSSAARLISMTELMENIHFIYKDHFSPILVVLIIIGMVTVFIRKKKNSLIYFAAIISAYIFFTFIKHDIPRYSMYWIPFFCLFAAEGITIITVAVSRMINNTGKGLIYVLILIPFLFQMSLLPKVFVPTASGYEEAAQYTINNSKSPVVLFDGYANGHFIFFMNIHDTQREFIVLRGDKLISSSSISYTNKLEVHLHDKNEISKALSDMGVQFIIVESENMSGLEIYTIFREMLNKSAQFKLCKTIDIKSNKKRFENVKLLVYENLMWPGINPDQELKLRLPVIGQTLELKMDRILPKQ
ncbi:MAG: hypothetical protein PF503_18525 [Desulfobacula sp.]|jgi:hypothetical protein|nr:hypothetical protein [Desulfobacula sp.]